MKHLIRYKKESLITLAAAAVILYILITGFMRGAEVQSVIESVVIVLSWFYNMPTSIEGDTAKKNMLEDKANRHKTTDGSEV